MTIAILIMAGLVLIAFGSFLVCRFALKKCGADLEEEIKFSGGRPRSYTYGAFITLVFLLPSCAILMYGNITYLKSSNQS